MADQPKPKPVLSLTSEPKARGANRSTKVAGKLKVLPDQPELDAPSGPISSTSGGFQPPPPPRREQQPAQEQQSTESSDEDEPESEQDVQEEETYNQISMIPEGTARRDALRLTKARAKNLPRVTAYATANSYRFHDLMKFFNARRAAYGTDAKTIEDVIYTPYAYEPATASEPSRSSAEISTADLLGIPELRLSHNGDGQNGQDRGRERDGDTDGSKKKQRRKRSKFDAAPAKAEVFIFKYGTVVIWGMTEPQEKRFLSSIKRFEVEKLAPEDVEMEDLNYYYANYSRIYNDVITLRKGSSYMTKLSLSHALSQSVKISLFEELISQTIEETKDLPESMSETGRIRMSHKEIMQKIGELFLLRTNISSVGSVLDSPEVFWSFPDLQPLYDAARSYLEIPQRISLLNTRVEVLQDMLQLLKESVASRHSERLEQIVIALIGLEIILGIITILVDLFS